MVDQKKIDGYIERMVDAVEAHNFSEARSYCVSILDRDPWNDIAIIFKRFLEGSVKLANGKYPQDLSSDNYFELLKQSIRYDAQTKCPKIFTYLKRLLRNIEVEPSDAIIELCKKVLDKLSTVEDEYVKDFIEYFSDFYETLTIYYETLEKDIQSTKRQYKEQEKNTRRCKSFSSIMEICFLFFDNIDVCYDYTIV